MAAINHPVGQGANGATAVFEDWRLIVSNSTYFFCIDGALRTCKGLGLDSCIIDNLNVVLAKLKTGWQRIDLPRLDPLELPATISSRYDDGNMTLDIVLKDATVLGPAHTQVQLVNVD
uniref:Uncharacterized protein n=1 Tax=Rhodnius prolixus TaxID=13249 RepID=T1HPB9_RHOPR